MTEKQIVWYILLTEVKIDSDTQSVTSLSVAPLAVLPEFQRKGIGGDVDSVRPIRGQHFWVTAQQSYWGIKSIILDLAIARLSI